MKKIANYIILSKIGESRGKTEVYLVKDSDNNFYAIKRFLRNSSNAKNEFNILSSLQRKEFIPINYNLFHTKKVPNIVLNYIEGYTLQNLITSGAYKEFDNDTISKMLSILSIAIEYIHSKNIAHRDIKPANIIVTADQSIVLIDYDKATSITTPENNVVGTVQYMAPEIAYNYRIGEIFDGYDWRCADYWAFGVIGYILVKSKYPYNRLRLGDSSDIYHHLLQLYKIRKDKVYYKFIKSSEKIDLEMRKKINGALIIDWENRYFCV